MLRIYPRRRARFLRLVLVLLPFFIIFRFHTEIHTALSLAQDHMLVVPVNTSANLVVKVSQLIPYNIGNDLYPAYHTIKCESMCTYFNPSILRFGDRIIVSYRETGQSLCSGFKVPHYIFGLLFRNTTSAVLFAEIVPSTLRRRLIYTKALARLPEMRLFKGVEGTMGFEDSRLFMHSDKPYIITSSQHYRRSQMFLAELNLDDSHVIKPRTLTVRMKYEFDAGANQKNWVYLPFQPRNPDSIHFVYMVNPLKIVVVAPSTGQTEFVFQGQPHADCPHGLRGSTPFILLSFKDNLLISEVTRPNDRSYLALVHSAYFPPPKFGESMPSYKTYTVRISENPWRITHISDAYSLPVEVGDEYVGRISYPTTILDDGEEYFVSFGSMDCTSHLAKLNKTALLGALKRIDV